MMFENARQRWPVTKQLRDKILELRNNNGLSASYIARNLPNKSQPWLSQIETGQIKSIRNDDLITLFSVLLSTNADVAKQYLLENDNLFIITSDGEQNGKPNNDIQYFTTEFINPIKKLQDQFQIYVQQVNDEFVRFFSSISSKEAAVNIMESIVKNLDSDIGFTLSVASLPFFVLNKASIEKKKAVFNGILDLIKENSDIPGYIMSDTDDEDSREKIKAMEDNSRKNSISD